MKKLTLFMALLCGLSAHMAAMAGSLEYKFFWAGEPSVAISLAVPSVKDEIDGVAAVASLSLGNESDSGESSEDPLASSTEYTDSMSDDEYGDLSPKWTKEAQYEALAHCVKNNDAARLLALSLVIPADVHIADCVNEQGQSQLINAVNHYIHSQTHAEVIDILRTYWGAWAEDMAGEGHDSALHMAIASGDKTLVQALMLGTSLKYPGNRLLYDDGGSVLSASCDLAGANGDTVLHRAVQTGDQEIIGLVLRRGAKVDAQNRFGNTPLHIAALTNNPASVNTLLDHGAKVEIVNGAGQTALELATSCGALAAVRAILEYGVVLTEEYCDSLQD